MTVRALLLAALSVGLAGASGCKKSKNQAPPEERGSMFRDAGLSGPSDPRYGSQGAVTVDRPTNTKPNNEASEVGGPATVKRRYKNCRKSVPVTKSDLATPEGTLHAVFTALLIPDEEAAFRGFYRFVDPEFQSEKDARRYWFRQARKYDQKKKLRPFLRLVYGEKNASFDYCEIRPEGPDTFRIFVGKSPPVGSNPPFVLHKVEDKWLLKTFSAF